MSRKSFFCVRIVCPCNNGVTYLQGNCPEMAGIRMETPLAKEHKLLFPLPGNGVPLVVTIAVTDQHGGVTTLEAVTLSKSPGQ